VTARRCYLCGSTSGPLLPDPAGDPADERFICSRGCPHLTTPEHAAAKDTHQGESTLSSDVLDLLAAIRDAADVPLPSLDPADERAWQRLMRRRLVDLHAVLEVALRPEWVDLLDPAREAADIRRRTADAPVEYTRYEPAETDGDR
jgi:hypothetical protein